MAKIQYGVKPDIFKYAASTFRIFEGSGLLWSHIISPNEIHVFSFDIMELMVFWRSQRHTQYDPFSDFLLPVDDQAIHHPAQASISFL